MIKMLSEAQVELQNAQHSILFLQREHAKTISGLHSEIAALQKKCAGLTFQLSMQDGRGDTGQETAILETKIDSLSKEIDELKRENSQINSAVEARDKRILLLEGQLRSKEKKFNDESKALCKKLTELQGEIDSKSNTIAILTSQIHQANRNSHNGAPIDKVRSANLESLEMGTYVPVMSPTPPSDGAPSKLRQRVYGRVTSSPSQQVSGLVVDATIHRLVSGDKSQMKTLAHTVKSLPARPKLSFANAPRPAHGHSASRREKELRFFSKPKPEDYKEFLQTGDKIDSHLVSRVKSEPLPPIVTDMSENTYNAGGSSSVMVKRKLVSPRTSAHQSVDPDINRFAVDTVSSPRKFIRQGQNPNAS